MIRAFRGSPAKKSVSARCAVSITMLSASGTTYVFEIIQQICDGISLAIGKHVFVIDFIPGLRGGLVYILWARSSKRTLTAVEYGQAAIPDCAHGRRSGGAEGLPALPLSLVIRYWIATATLRS